MVALFHGEPERAIEQLEVALAAHHASGNLFGAALALIHLANSSTLLGDVGRSLTFCEESLALSAAHDERWCAALALWTQGVAVWWQRRHPARVRSLQAQSIRMREPFDDRWGIALSVELLAWVAHEEGQSEKAARLLGALHEAWRSLGASLPAPLAGEHDQCVAAVRQSVGQRAFEAAFQDGQGLAIDDAVRYALGEKTSRQPAAAGRDVDTVHLTRRETEIAELVAAGLSNKEIAAKLVIAQRTAEGHVEHILAKLGFTSRAQVAAWFAENRARGD
jgi:DNA-binding CsgD family transcriptional regulator